MKKSLICLAALVAVLCLSSSSKASVPSSGASIQSRKAVLDGNGQPFSNGNADVGYKVFVSTSNSAIQLVDEAGVAPTCGLVHAVWVSSGAATSDYAALYDSAPVTLANFTATNQGSNVVYEIAPILNRATALPTLYTLDVQFNYGAILLQNGGTANGTTHVLWRPCRGGSQ